MEMMETVRMGLAREGVLPEGGRILAAVSGGADSLCMAGVLHELGFRIGVAHFDHRLRAESGMETVRVRDAARQWDAPFHPGSGDVLPEARRRRKTIEETARRMRYEFLLSAARAGGYAAVATGHTADDQAETVLMHFLRGTGADGLRGILPASELGSMCGDASGASIRLVRPLLAIRRTQTEQFCEDRGWIPVEDASNADTRFWRNRIRRELMPGLARYNPRLVERLGALAEVMRAQTEWVELLVDHGWDALMVPAASDEIRFPLQQFRAQPLALRRELLRRAVARLLGSRIDLAFRHIRQAVDFADCPTLSGSADLALGLKVEIRGEVLSIRKAASNADEAEDHWLEVTLPIPGSVQVGNGSWEICVDYASEGVLPTDLFAVIIPRGAVQLPLTVRPRRRGDRFTPKGMAQLVKLADFMAAQHLPAPDRPGWPLLCDQAGILWVPGYRLDHRVADGEGPGERILVRVRRLSQGPA